MYLWFPRIGAYIHSVHIARGQGGHDEEVPLQLRVVVATGADIPSSMVKLVCDIASVSAMNDLLIKVLTFSFNERAYV